MKCNHFQQHYIHHFTFISTFICPFTFNFTWLSWAAIIFNNIASTTSLSFCSRKLDLQRTVDKFKLDFYSPSPSLARDINLRYWIWRADYFQHFSWSVGRKDGWDQWANQIHNVTFLFCVSNANCRRTQRSISRFKFPLWLTWWLGWCGHTENSENFLILTRFAISTFSHYEFPFQRGHHCGHLSLALVALLKGSKIPLFFSSSKLIFVIWNVANYALFRANFGKICWCERFYPPRSLGQEGRPPKLLTFKYLTYWH